MIVKCVRIKVQEFPLNSKVHLDYFGSRLRGRAVETGYDDLVVGKEYVVYAICETQGYPFYFVKTSDQYFWYYLRPSPCFEIVDSTVSKYWHYKQDVYVSMTGEEIFRSSLGIKEWDEDGFVNRLIDEKQHEKEIWLNMAKKIKAEALQARADNLG